MSIFDIFTLIFAILIALGVAMLVRRRHVSGEHNWASLGLAIGLGFGGAAGLILSRAAGTFVYILPVSLGVGMALGWGVGWAIDSLMQKD